MHVAVSDQHRKNQPAHKLIGPSLTRFGPQHRGDIRVAAMPVFVVWEHAEDLREVLHVDAPSASLTVKAAHCERTPSHTRSLRRQSPDVTDGNQASFRYLDASRAGQL